MKKKGFTLIELLAVLTILAIILLISFPLLNNTINTSKDNSRKNSINLYGKAIETAIADYYTENPEVGSVTLDELETGGYLKYKGNKVECNEVQIVHRNVYLNDCKVGKKYVDYTYGKVIPVPELAQGLTPIEYDGDKWVVADSDSDTWYNYDKQKWANAVTLLPGVRKNIGDEVKVDGTEASMMLVWIPRYEYKIEGDFGKGGQSADLPGEIEVNFIGKNKTTSTKGYHIHPAFNFDGEKSGFWVGKFELSHETLSSNTTTNNLGCSSTNCTNASGLQILPNKPALRYNDISNFWYGIKSIENTSTFGLTNIDTHMMKNSEWGAVAYLSQSKYGKYGNSDYENKYKEVYQNKSNNFITGSSNGIPSISSTQKRNPQCLYDDMTNLEEDSNGYKMGQCGPGASTTGNIYGVYDMSGGSYEYVMGAYGPEYPTTTSSGFENTVFTENVIESKYYDVYKMDNVEKACDNNKPCLGHALSETNGWYRDYSYMVNSSNPWFIRGGSINNNNNVGIFSFYNGAARETVFSTRVVGFEK